MNTKIYITVLLAITIFLCACEKSYVEPAGLLDGYSFETDPIQFSSSFYVLDDYALSWTDQEAFDGSSSLQITSNKKDNESFAFWHLPYSDFELNQPFKIKIRVKTVGMEGNGNIQVNMFARSEDRQRNIASGIGEQISDTGGEWETIEVSLATIPVNEIGVIDIYFLFTPGSTGTVYWDKLEVFTGE